MTNEWVITQQIDAVERIDTALAAQLSPDERHLLVVTRDGELCSIDLEHLQINDRVALIDGERVLSNARFFDAPALSLSAHVGTAFEPAMETLTVGVNLDSFGKIALNLAPRAAAIAPPTAQRQGVKSASTTTVLARSKHHGGCVAQTVNDKPWMSVANRFEIRSESTGELLFPPYGFPRWSLFVSPHATLVALSNGERVLLFDARSGALLAEHAIAGRLIEWASDGVSLLLVSSDMALVLVTLHENGLEERWRVASGLRADAWFDATIAPSCDRVIVTGSGFLLIIDVRDGSVSRVQSNFTVMRLASACFVNERECAVGTSSSLSLFDVETQRFRSWIDVVDPQLSIAGVCSSGAIATRDGAYALLMPGREPVVVEVDTDVAPGVLAARNAALFGVCSVETRVDFVRVDGRDMGSVAFDQLAPREALETYAMSADGTTLAVLTTHGRVLIVKFQGDPRSVLDA